MSCSSRESSLPTTPVTPVSSDPFGRPIVMPQRIRARPESMAHSRLPRRRQTLSHKPATRSKSTMSASPSVETMHYLFPTSMSTTWTPEPMEGPRLYINGHPLISEPRLADRAKVFAAPRPVPPIPLHRTTLSPRLPVSDFGAPLCIKLPGEHPTAGQTHTARPMSLLSIRPRAPTPVSLPSPPEKTTWLARSISRLNFASLRDKGAPFEEAPDATWTHRLKRRISGRQLRKGSITRRDC